MKRRLQLSEREHEYLIDLMMLEDANYEDEEEMAGQYPSEERRMMDQRTCRRILNKLKKLDSGKEVSA